MLAIANIVAHGPLGFNTEIVVRTLVFLNRLHIGHTVSVRNTMARQQFHCKTEGLDAITSSGLGQHHDFADPLAFEPLNP